MEKGDAEVPTHVHLDAICYGPRDQSCDRVLTALELARNELILKNVTVSYSLKDVLPPHQLWSGMNLHGIHDFGISKTLASAAPRIIIDNKKIIYLNLKMGTEELVDELVNEVLRYILKERSKSSSSEADSHLSANLLFSISLAFNKALIPSEVSGTPEKMSSVGETEYDDDRIRG